MEIEKTTRKYGDGTYAKIYHKKGDKNYYHREDGPAYIGYNKDGSIRHEAYWINNKPHREDGPSYIEYDGDGSIKAESYCINDNALTKEDWYSEYGWKLKLKGTPMGEIFLTKV